MSDRTLMRRVGVTGSRDGFISNAQRYETFLAIAKAYEPGAEFHHGDCVGVDDETARYAASIGYLTVAHPPTPSEKCYRAFHPSDDVLPALPYMKRNKMIIAWADVMVAVPSGPEKDQPRSGTWWTIRLARKAGVPIEVIL